MKRASGILMHISCLFGNYSTGSFGEAARSFIDFLTDCGFSYWQVLPFNMVDDCGSPYKSFGAFSGNPYFIDLPMLFRMGLITREELDDAVQKTPYATEFDRLGKERLSLLFRAAERFDGREKVEAFMDTHPHVRRFCTFMALKEANGGKEWTQWTTNDCDPAVLYGWKFVQYMFFTQWQKIRDYAHEKNISIIGDIPIYVSFDSSDVWSVPELFALDKENTPTGVAGVPPDYFCEDGQLWGNPLYNWDVMKRDGYAWWRQRLCHMLEMFDGVRIDHFRGICSYWSVPSRAETAKEGHWEKGPGMDLINALKAEAGDKLIIAEDLGDIDADVVALVEESGFPGMRVAQFGFTGDKNTPHVPYHYTENCVAYTGTHDNNTLLGFMWESREDVRDRVMRYCGYYGNDWSDGCRALLREMLASHAGLVIFPIQDIFVYGADTRMNVPGRAEGNWTYRITAEQLAAVDRASYRRMNELYGRI